MDSSPLNPGRIATDTEKGIKIWNDIDGPNHDLNNLTISKPFLHWYDTLTKYFSVETVNNAISKKKLSSKIWEIWS